MNTKQIITDLDFRFWLLDRAFQGMCDVLQTESNADEIMEKCLELRQTSQDMAKYVSELYASLEHELCANSSQK